MRIVRKVPAVEKRVETGAVRFGDGWPGLFIRGDDCIRLMFLLNEANPSPDNEFLIEDLLNGIESATGKRLQ